MKFLGVNTPFHPKKGEKTKMVCLTRQIIIIIVSIIFLVNCSDSKGRKVVLPDKSYPLTLVKKKEKKLDIISKFGPVFAKIDVQAEQRIYLFYEFSEKKEWKVMTLNPDIEDEVTYILPRGEGPGELLSPYFFGGDKQSHIVYDGMGKKYVEFTIDLKSKREIRRHEFGGLYNGIKYFIPEKRLLIEASLEDISKGGNRLDYQVKLYTRTITDSTLLKENSLFETVYCSRDENKKYIQGKPLDYRYVFDHIFILDKRDYRLMKMTLEGKVIKDFRVQFQIKTFTEAERKKFLYGFETNQVLRKHALFPDTLWSAMSVVPIGNGIAVPRCNDYDNTSEKPITADYFDPDLNFLGKITLPYYRHWNHPSYSQLSSDDFLLNFPKSKKLYSIETRGEDEDEYWLLSWDIVVN